MKVPTLVTTRTQAPQDVGAYSTFQASPGPGGTLGLDKLGAGVQQVGEMLQAREDRSDRIKALTDFSDFETQTAQTVQNMKREAPADAAGFWKTVPDVIDKGGEDFLSKLPAGLQDEFRQKIVKLRGTYTVDAQDFQYKQGDAYYTQQVGTQLDKSKQALDPRLGGNPAFLDAQKQTMAEFINAYPDATPAMKLDFAKKSAAALEGVAMKAQITDDVKRFGGSAGSTAADLIRGEEGYNEKAFGDKNAQTGAFSAYRAGYSSDTYTNPDGSYGTVTKGTVVDRAGAERDLARRIKDMESATAATVGKDRWDSLPANVKAGVTSVTYNYGSVPASVANVIRNGGDAAAIAGAVASLPANPDRRKREANLILGTYKPPTSVDNNPQFANVPYEDRISIARDATTQAHQEVLAQQKASTDIYNAGYNTLATGIHDGKMGQTNIDDFRQRNPGMDYKDVMGLDAALASYNRKLDTALTAQQKFDSGATFDPNSKEDKDALNAYVGTSGLQKLDQSDGKYVNDVLTPAVTKANDIPTDVAGQLMGMLRSNTQTKALFALETLAKLQDADSRAFKQRLPQNVQDDVQYWRDRRGTMPADELMKQLNPGATTEERNARQQRRTDAETFLSKDVDKIPRIDTLLADAVSQHKSWWFGTTPKPAQVATAGAALQRDYQTAFVDFYEKTGSYDGATKAAKERIKNDWDVTDVGNPVLMRRPPEKSGYKPYMGSYDYIDADIRTANKLEKTDQYQIISDDRTEQEFRQFQAGGRPPSYKVVVKKAGEDFYRAPIEDTRQWFQVPADIKRADDNWKDTVSAQVAVNGQLNESTNTLLALQARGQKPHPEDLKAHQDLIETAARLEDQRKVWEKGHKIQPVYAPPGYNPADSKTFGSVNPFNVMTRPGT